MNGKYQKYINKQAVEVVFASGDVNGICQALLFVTLNHPDWEWVQAKCLDLLTSDSCDVRGLAATCLGHVARIHRQLDKEKVLNALRKHRDDRCISGRIADAIEDIEMFMR